MPSFVKDSLNSGINAIRTFARDLDGNALHLAEEDLGTARIAAAIYIAVALAAALV